MFCRSCIRFSFIFVFGLHAGVTLFVFTRTLEPDNWVDQNYTSLSRSERSAFDDRQICLQSAWFNEPQVSAGLSVTLQ
jgi:hypothetical protein